jgi:hypothetical protein
MDKQKMDLDQLYRERFQSFEMEPSTGVNSLMKQKLKYVKSMQLIKWIAIAVLTTTAVATITFLWLRSDESQVENILPKTQSTIETLNEKTKSNTHQISNTETNEETAINEPVLLDKTPLKSEENQDEPNHSTSTAETAKENESYEKEFQNKEVAPVKESVFKDENHLETLQNTEILEEVVLLNATTEGKSHKNKGERDQTEESQMVVQLDKNSKREALGFEYLEYKTQFLAPQENHFSWQKKDVDLSPTNLIDSKSNKAKPGKIQIPNQKPLQNKKSNLYGYFDLHFSPMIWKNQAILATPELDNAWTYKLNHQAQLSYEYGFSFQLHHKNTPLFLQLGFDYQILKEKIDFLLSHTFEDPELSYWTYDSAYEYPQIIDTIFVIIEDDHFVIDTIFTHDTILANVDSAYFPVNSTKEEAQKYINTYTYLNIPLMLGYEFKSKSEHWRFQILAGASLAINLTNDGYFYTKTGDFETYSGKVKPEFVWNFQAAANINYRWKKWQLFAQPEFQYQLNESQLQDRIPKRKYQFYKMKFGIRYQLF